MSSIRVIGHRRYLKQITISATFLKLLLPLATGTSHAQVAHPSSISPKGVIAISGSKQVELSWFPTATSGTTYRIYSSSQEMGVYKLLGTSKKTSVLFKNLSIGTPYYFKVTAQQIGKPESAASYSVVTIPSDTPSNVYEVGADKKFTSLSDVPWNSLAPGALVKVFWRSGPYREKILISNSGTATKPIRIMGIPGPLGQLPVIDGQNATTKNASYSWSGFEECSLFMIGRRAGQFWKYSPSYIIVEGLEVRNSHQKYTFTNAAGAVKPYSRSACGIYLYGGSHIVLRGNIIDGNGNGIFGLPIGRDITIQGNIIYNNGNKGSDRQHNVYTETIGITFEYNYFGSTCAGSGGALLKDRSAGTIIRYNLFENDRATRVMDLVEPQEGGADIYNDPSQDKTFVYGNIIDQKLGGRLIHYGGDQGFSPAYRKGVLYFYNNTVVVREDRKKAWRTCLFQADTNEESIDIRNNIIYFSSLTPGAIATNFSLMTSYGHATVGVNWCSPATRPFSDAQISAGRTPGDIVGIENLLTNSNNSPGFANLDQSNFSLISRSVAIDQGTLQAQGVPIEHQPVLQHSSIGTVENRPIWWNLDLGAFEWMM